MGTLKAPPRKEVRVIAAMVGTGTMDKQSPFKARMWLLEDKELVVATATPTFQIQRVSFQVESATIGKSNATFNLENGSTISIRIKSCNCGMGILSSAKVINERHRITRVLPPEWVEMTG